MDKSEKESEIKCTARYDLPVLVEGRN